MPPQVLAPGPKPCGGKNPELCSVHCGDEFGLTALTGMECLTLHYDSVEKLGWLACFKCLFFASSRSHFRIKYVAFYSSYERKLGKR